MDNMIAVVQHANIKAFLQQHSQTPGPYKKLFLFLALTAVMGLGALVSYSLVVWIAEGMTTSIIQVSAAGAFSISAMIVIHEWIHGMLYKAYGAQRVYYGGSIRKFVFYAAADGDVFNGRQFRVIALAPFMIVTAIGVCLLICFPQYWAALATMLCLHTLFCGGDFLFVHFLSQYNLDRLRTHDERDRAETYFYYVD